MELNEQTLKKAYSFLSKDKCLKFLINKFSNQININERYDDNYYDKRNEILFLGEKIDKQVEAQS